MLRQEKRVKAHRAKLRHAYRISIYKRHQKENSLGSTQQWLLLLPPSKRVIQPICYRQFIAVFLILNLFKQSSHLFFGWFAGGGTLLGAQPIAAEESYLLCS